MFGFWTFVGALALATPTGGAPAAGAEQSSDDCDDDRGIDRCAPDQQKRVRELFGLEPIERHIAAGDQVRRVFYVDGYGRDVVAIVFIRPRGGDPQLRVHFPLREGEARRKPLEALVPQQVWESMIERSALFDRNLVPLQPSGDDPMTISLHSWGYTIEAADPDAASAGEKLRRKVGDACNDHLVQSYALDVSRAAVPLLPACALLERRNHRNWAALLAACSLLAGDRLAAAEVMNRAEIFRQARRREDIRLLDGIFSDEAVVDWSARRNTGRRSAAAFWLEQGAGGGSEPNLFLESVEGLGQGRTRLKGAISRMRAGDSNGYERAEVEQIWAPGLSGEPEIEKVTVGPWRRAR
jgi:hypothetical protein